MKSVLAALTVALAARTIHAQELRGVHIVLGEQRTAALRKLARYQAAPTKGDSTLWTVSDTSEWNGAPDYGNVGMLGVRNGAIVSVHRRWRISNVDPISAIAAFMAAARQLDGEAGCSVKSRRIDSPDFVSDGIVLRCGGHLIAVSIDGEGANRRWYIDEDWLGHSQ